MNLSTAEINKLPGCRTRALGQSALYARLTDRSWFRGDRVNHTPESDRRNHQINFSAIWPLDGGRVGHRPIGLSLKLALESAGDLVVAADLH